jgi:chromosome segregation ATPase
MKLDLAAKEASVGDLTLKLSAALACQSDNAVRAGEVEKVAAERDDQAKRLIESNVRAAELEQQIEELKRNLQTLTGEQTSIADELNTANGESQRAQEEILKMQKTYELLQNENQAAKLKAHAQLKEKNENIHQKDAEVQ